MEQLHANMGHKPTKLHCCLRLLCSPQLSSLSMCCAFEKHV